MPNKDGNLGLERGIVKLIPYYPEWKQAFSTEEMLLRKAIGDYIMSIDLMVGWRAGCFLLKGPMNAALSAY